MKNLQTRNKSTLHRYLAKRYWWIRTIILPAVKEKRQVFVKGIMRNTSNLEAIKRKVQVMIIFL